MSCRIGEKFVPTTLSNKTRPNNTTVERTATRCTCGSLRAPAPTCFHVISNLNRQGLLTNLPALAFLGFLISEVIFTALN